MSEKTSMLTDVVIEGLRGVGRVVLKFDSKRRVFTLFGVNGLGKTKCLEALYQFLLLSNKDFLGALKGGSLKSSALVMTCMSGNGSTFDTSKINYFSNNNQPFGQNQLHQFPVVFLGAVHRASLDASNAPSDNALGTSTDRRNKYFSKILNSINSGCMNSLGMANDARGWFVKRAQSANPYQKSSDNRKVEIDAVLSMLHEVDERFDQEFLEIRGDDKVFLKVDDKEREFGELSSGFASLVKMMQAIVAGYAAFTNEVNLRNVRGIVLIDEIDSHLHARWQTTIIGCLKKLLPNTTFYFATHSPLVLSQLLEGEAHLLKRGDDGVVRSDEIAYPNRRLHVDVLEEVLGVDLNKLKLASMEEDDQTEAKQRLLSLLESLETQEGAEE